MKVIDLLNKIANGEEVPKEITIEDADGIFGYDKDINSYKSYNNEYLMSDYLFNTARLNKSVEVIEEDKKIEKLYIRDRANDILIGKSEKICYATSSLVNKEIALKINEIIGKINKGEKQCK